jgi:hypothetical protein
MPAGTIATGVMAIPRKRVYDRSRSSSGPTRRRSAESNFEKAVMAMVAAAIKQPED